MKFIWNLLAKKIKTEIVEPIKIYIPVDEYNQIKDVPWFDLINKLNLIFDTIVKNYDICSGGSYTGKIKFTWWNLPISINKLKVLQEAFIECEA